MFVLQVKPKIISTGSSIAIAYVIFEFVEIMVYLTVNNFISFCRYVITTIVT